MCASRAARSSHQAAAALRSCAGKRVVLGAPTLGGEAGGESDTCEVVSHEAWEKVEVAHEARDEMHALRLRCARKE